MLFLASCKEISFEQPQPKGKKSLTEFPKSLRGKYLTRNENGGWSKDTVVIEAKGYHFGFFDPADRDNAGSDEFDRGFISDTLVLKSHKGYFFLNLLQRPQWALRVLRPEKNGDLTFMAPEQDGVDFKDYVKKLSAEIRVDSFLRNDKMFYQIDPSPNELVRLIEKGFFSKAILKKIK